MPQMMPMNWIILFMLTNLIFFIFLIFNYFLFKFNTNIAKNIKSNSSKNDKKSIPNFWPLY